MAPAPSLLPSHARCFHPPPHPTFPGYLALALYCPLPPSPPLRCRPAQLEKASLKVNEHARRSAEAHKEVRQKQREREALYTELAAAAARDEDQRALLKATVDKARQAEPHTRSLLEPPPQGALGAPPSAPAEAEMVTLASLSEEKTQLKASCLPPLTPSPRPPRVGSPCASHPPCTVHRHSPPMPRAAPALR